MAEAGRTRAESALTAAQTELASLRRAEGPSKADLAPLASALASLRLNHTALVNNVNDDLAAFKSWMVRCAELLFFLVGLFFYGSVGHDFFFFCYYSR